MPESEILPPEDADPTVPGPVASAPQGITFDPVPRRAKLWNGITAIKQQRFIEALAETGSVTMAARTIGASPNAMYQLRRGAGAESFASAWEEAVDAGARRVLDLLVEHAIHGTPETLSKDGQVVLERRRYNARTMQWIVAHRFPEQFGDGETGLMGMRGMSGGMKRLKEKWRAEWEAEAAARAEEAISEEEAAEFEATMTRLAERYRSKVIEERIDRARGDWSSADFSLRQLTYLEAILETGGQCYEWVKKLFAEADAAPLPAPGTPEPPDAHPGITMGRRLRAMRAEAWEMAAKEIAEADALPEDEKPYARFVRPPLIAWSDDWSSCHTENGPTAPDRTTAREQAQAMMVHAERMWNAARSEAEWAAFVGELEG